MKMRFFITFFMLIAVISCNPRTEQQDQSEGVETFANQVAFLQQHGPVQILTNSSGGRIAVSALYQGRVMTSSVEENGPGLGWINKDFIEAGKTGTQFDNYGGEDRFWLGPEGGQYALYFPPDSVFSFSNWQVPAALQEGEWPIISQSDSGIVFEKSMRLTNYSGTPIDLSLQRNIQLLSRESVRTLFGITVPYEIKWVGYESVNRVTNTGSDAWTREKGMPSIWILGCFNPFDTTYVAIPYKGEKSDSLVNDAYFGAVPPERLEIRENHILFKCDGKYRSKIGLGPKNVMPVLGSYNAANRILTLVQFNFPDGASEYVNSMWEIQQKPYGGDVINSYNDGPVEPGKPALGGFYEIETSSPALNLPKGNSYTHIHRTMHLTGSPQVLDEIARSVLGVSISEMTSGIRPD